MKNFNPGNAKHAEGDGRDWCYFPCDEVVLASLAHHLVAQDPQHCRIEWEKGGRAGIAFTPPHPYCAFRSFPTLADGCEDYLTMLNHRFASAWPAVIAGDPRLFAHMLKMSGYYTAPEAQYTNTLTSLFQEFTSKLAPSQSPTPAD